MTAEFEKASAEPAPTHVDEFNRAAKEPIDLTAEFERASGSGDGEGEASGDAAQDPAPEAEIKIERRRRRTRDRTPDEERSTRKTRSDRDKDNDGRRLTIRDRRAGGAGTAIWTADARLRINDRRRTRILPVRLRALRP